MLLDISPVIAESFKFILARQEGDEVYANAALGALMQLAATYSQTHVGATVSDNRTTATNSTSGGGNTTTTAPTKSS